MAGRGSLRDYQRHLAERLATAGHEQAATKLGVEVGAEGWLVDLSEAGEVLPVPPVAPVPLTRPWFKGVANIRGKLFSIVDFSAFLGGAATATGDQARLLLLGEHFRTAAAILVGRSLGLRNAVQLTMRSDALPGMPWIRNEYDDSEGRTWKELDVARLAQDPQFMDVAA